MTHIDTTHIDHRSALQLSYDHAAAIVGGIDRASLGRPTPCPSYDVAALVDHLVGAGHRAAALGRGETPTGNELPHVELAGAPDELRSTGKEAAAAWSDDRRLAATVTMPWGEAYTGETLVDMYLAELAAHAWDLAVATGQLERLDARLAPVALEAARGMLKPEYRNLAEPGSPYGDEVAAPADATDWERFAAFLGRDPRPYR